MRANFFTQGNSEMLKAPAMSRRAHGKRTVRVGVAYDILKYAVSQGAVNSSGDNRVRASISKGTPQPSVYSGGHVLARGRRVGGPRHRPFVVAFCPEYIGGRRACEKWMSLLVKRVNCQSEEGEDCSEQNQPVS